MNEMKCRRCGANENRIHGFCSMECETAWYYEDDIRDLTARITELEGFIGKLIELGEWGMIGMEIATSFRGGEMHNLAIKQGDKWNALVKDWKEREE